MKQTRENDMECIETQNDEIKVFRIFVIFLIVCGFFLVFLTPPMAVPDENTHFLDAYSLSTGSLIPSSKDFVFLEEREYPSYILSFTEAYNNKFPNALDEKMTFGESYFLSWLNVSDESRVAVVYDNFGTRIQWAYIFSGLAMFIAKLMLKIIGDSFDTAYNLMLAGRLGNFFAYALFGILAVKLTPYLKKTMMLVLLLPTSLFLGASLSYDAIILPISMLFVAELLLLLSDEKKEINIKDVAIILVCALFMVSIKIVYAPFLGLLFFVPLRKFVTKKKYFLSIGLVIAVFFVGYVLPSLLSKMSNDISSNFASQEVIIQKEYFLKHLYYFPSIIFCTFKQYGSFYLTSFIGKLGQLDTNYPTLIIVLFLFVLVTTTIVESNSSMKLPVPMKMVIFLIGILSISAMFAVMYVGWTPLVLETKGNIVSGVQGRYFLPFYCFFAMILFSDFSNRIPKKIMNRILIANQYLSVISMIIMAISTPLIILLRFWI